MSKQLVLCLWGGPGSGKSTTAAYVFSRLKYLGYNVELVTEFAKEFAWKYPSVGEMLKHVSQDEIAEEQFGRQKRLDGKVELIITDSPLMLGTLYGGDKEKITLNDSVFENMNVLIKRNKEYNPAGRFQTEEEARAIDDLCVEHCSVSVDGSIAGGNELLDMCIEVLNERRLDALAGRYRIVPD